MIPAIRGQYHLQDKLGSGGMGDVYQARDSKLNRMVAIKVLKADAGDPARRKRFLQEAQAASSLNHPNIVTIYDIASEGDLEFIIMEFVGGKTLADLIPRGGLRVPQLINYGFQIADGLSAAHSAGIVHRDLKPGNIMVTDKDRIKILDFGLAKLEFRLGAGDPDATSDSPLTIQGSIVGTLCYMSPEQAQGLAVDARSDIFSFGAVMYEAATGQRAFSGDNGISMLSSVLRDEPARTFRVTPDIPSELDELIHRCLRKNPDERYPDMHEVRQVLARLKQSSDSGVLYRGANPASMESESIPTTISAAPAKSHSHTNRTPLYVGVGILAVIAAAGAWWFSRTPASGPAPVAESQSLPTPTEPNPPNPVAATPRDATLTNEKIIAMVAAKVPDALIVSQIQTSKSRFDLSPDELIRLAQAGVSEAVLQSMRDPSGSQATEAASATSVTLRDGTEIPLVLSEDVPLDSEPRAAIRFSVARDVVVDGKIAVPKGSSALGSVLSVGKRKRFLIVGGGVRMLVALHQIEARGGQPIPLRATEKPKSGESAGRALESQGEKPPDIAALKGTPFNGFISGDQTISLKLTAR